MLILPRLDLMIAYSCNISCRGCISVSDIKRNGIEPYEEISASLQKWQHKVTPEIVAIFGGEPCLHPKLLEICQDVRQTWPNARIRLITNGYLLGNFDSASWHQFDNFEIQVSIHRKDHETYINQHIKNILLHKKDWRVEKFGGSDHKQVAWISDNLTVYKSIFQHFVVPYRAGFKPYDSDPVLAHKICGAGATPILYKGKLYKCPPVANIIDITGTHYKNYCGYDVDDDLQQFVDAIGKPEPVCGFCPDQVQATVVDHFNKDNVIVKQKIIS
jgi:sulfatase maturation enzyme AslB (radical SAM superfamily)